MNANCYIKQQERALKRKMDLITYKGGKCEICGYDKNIAALDFHHINPDDKSFQLDARHLSNTNIEKIKEEVDKCILVCANCHREIHNPSLQLEYVTQIINDSSTQNIQVLNEKKKTSVCPFCGKKFMYSKGKKFCSKECYLKSKNYPSYDDVKIKYEELKSWEKVAKFYGLTRKIIHGIIKRAER